MKARYLLALAFVVACASNPDSTVCATGIVCPSPLQCAAAQQVCITNNCGNGKVESGEECDDGNILPGDGCNPTCQNEKCGNGVIDPGEVCDLGPNNGKCQGCSSDCVSNESCGNNVVDTECGEVCDLGPNTANACNGCDATCKSTQVCGNGITDPECGEVCDPPGVGGCQPGCKSTGMCGNGYVDPGEECDNGLDTSKPRYNCDNCDCRLDCVINRCGDGYKNTKGTNLEDCDPAPMASAGSRVATPIETMTCNLDCSSAMCGDGKINQSADEQCDKGAANADDADCTLGCKANICGDGKKDTVGPNDMEQCDGGAANGATSCAYKSGTGVTSNSCTVCTSACATTTVTGPYCGDGAVSNGEVCDDGTGINGTTNCPYGELSCTICKADCSGTIAGAPSGCGDGTKQPGESCDDGSANGSTSCPYLGGSGLTSNNCSICNRDCSHSNNLKGPFCGDGAVSNGESCDDGFATNGTTLCPYGQPNCKICKADCSGTIDGTPSTCGDGMMQTGENCDDGSANGSTSCPYKSGANVTSNNCTLCKFDCSGTNNLKGPYCGDGAVSNGESCDDGTGVNGTTLCPYGEPNCQICNSTCNGSVSGTPRTCGDGTKNGPEFCDDGSLNGANSCAYKGGAGVTSNTCSICNNICTARFTHTGPYCGDRAVSNGEVCDDGTGVNGTTSCPYGEPSCTICNADCTGTISGTLTGCSDAVQDGPESDIDCGGITCIAEGKLCANGLMCNGDADCISNNCNGGTCKP